MKKGIHPDYHFVEVQLNDGTTSTPPAWTGGQQQLMDRGGRLTRFNKKFAGFVKG
jgi:large subunit ribosomal protein L31